MKEILGTAPVSLPLPPIHAFIKFNQFVSTKDISLLYGIPHLQVELEMKKLLLQQMVERIQTVHGTFWRYTGKIC